MADKPKQELLDILACPKCKGDVKYDAEKNVILCGKCKLKYEVLPGGIPNMLIEEAKKY
jgi:hypothetical protein